MKLQLLLVLAVAALVPSLSESRIFSKCELKTIFEKSISLHGQIKKHMEEHLAAIICHLNETSGLDSNLVTIEGVRAPRTTATPSTLQPTKDTEGPKEPTTTNTTSNTTTPATATPTTTASTDVSTSGPTPLESSSPSGSRKRRRRSSKNNKNTDSQKSRNSKESSEEMFDVKTRCDTQEMEEDYAKKRNKGSSNFSEEEHQMTVWSLGKYGIFQLTDSHFCDSGYRWSRNVCKTNCSAFTDDDIQDDIKCFMDSKYLGCFLEKISDFCRAQVNTYLNGCS